MKLRLLSLALVAGLVLALFASPAGASGSRGQDRTLLDVVAASGGDFDRNRFDYDVLLNAALAIGETDNPIVDTLADPSADVTVFAPNDLAFVRLARDLGYHGWDEEGAFGFIAANLPGLTGADLRTSLINVILYHVSPGAKDVFRVLFSREITTALPGTEPLRPQGFRLRDAATGLRDPSLTFPANVRAVNGIVHTIDRVLVPLPV